MTHVGFVGSESRLNPENGTYTFTSLPRALLEPRSNYRNYSKGEEIIRNGSNRSLTVIRKNGYGHGRSEQLTPWAMTVRMIPDVAVSPELFRMKAPIVNHSVSKTKSSRGHNGLNSTYNGIKNHPPPGRKHLETQTEIHLEELTNCIKEVDAVCQTEESLESCLNSFVPIKSPTVSTTDAATQIDEDEFFDFDMESQPVLETIINQAVRWAVVELLQEEDIADIKRQRRRFQQLRKAYLNGQKFNIKQAENNEIFNASNTMHSIHTWAYTTQTEAVQTDLEKTFLPWIMEEVEGELKDNKKSI
ncbi:Radial spoke head protein 3 [Chamberlinius hualienensis]